MLLKEDSARPIQTTFLLPKNSPHTRFESIFFVFTGARLSASTIPAWPLSGGRGPLTLHCDLEAEYEGGVWAPEYPLQGCVR